MHGPVTGHGQIVDVFAPLLMCLPRMCMSQVFLDIAATLLLSSPSQSLAISSWCFTC